MAKINKTDQARKDGMDYAYRILKEKGIESLEKRVDRNRKTFAPAFLSDYHLDEFEKEVKTNCILTIMCSAIMVLHDKFGYGPKRLERFKDELIEMCDSVAKKYLSFNDIVSVIREETGIELADKKELADILLRELEEKLNEN